MEQIPPGPGRERRPSGTLSLRPPPAEPVSKLFSTGPLPTLEGAAVRATKRTERGVRIISDVRRTIIYAAIFLGVGLILALFVSTLFG